MDTFGAAGSSVVSLSTRAVVRWIPLETILTVTAVCGGGRVVATVVVEWIISSSLFDAD